MELTCTATRVVSNACPIKHQETNSMFTWFKFKFIMFSKNRPIFNRNFVKLLALDDLDIAIVYSVTITLALRPLIGDCQFKYIGEH